MANNDIYGRKLIDLKKPVLADMATIIWGSGDTGSTGDIAPVTLVGVTQFQLSYNQAIQRRRTLGGSPSGRPIAVLIPTQPNGQITIQTLVYEENGTEGYNRKGFMQGPGFDVCQGYATLTIDFTGATAYENCTTEGPSMRCHGCTVTSYGMSAEAEGLQVIESMTIDFLQLELI